MSGRATLGLAQNALRGVIERSAEFETILHGITRLNIRACDILLPHELKSPKTLKFDFFRFLHENLEKN